jgi:hypothetical protein
MADCNDRGQGHGFFTAAGLVVVCLGSAVAGTFIVLGALSAIVGPVPTWIWTATMTIELLASVVLACVLLVARR